MLIRWGSRVPYKHFKIQWLCNRQAEFTDPRAEKLKIKFQQGAARKGASFHFPSRSGENIA